MKRVILLALCLALLLPAASVAERAAVSESQGMDWQENDPWPFAIYHGDRDVPQVAVTMDDCFEFEWVEKSWELITSFGGAMTIYPVGELIKENVLKPGDRDMWQRIADSSSEIGTHTHHHVRMDQQSDYNMVLYSKYPQYVTDQLLGYHYPLRTLRPPYGNWNATLKQKLKTVGYSHVILWDVVSTDPDEVLRQVKNGSILLFHARHKDYVCLQTVIPELVNRGYQLVTVSEMLGLPPLEPEEMYIWSEHKSEYFN